MATAALFRMGQVYDGFAEALATAGNKPPRRAAGSVTAYRHDQRVRRDIQDKAVELFATGYKKRSTSGYDEYTAKIREALAALAAEVPAGRESRGRERIGDRPPRRTS